MSHAELLAVLDAKLDECAACALPHEVARVAQALLALADHPSRHAANHPRTFTAAFSQILPPDLDGVAERFERCRNILRARFAKEPARGLRALFECALGGVAHGVQKPARPLLLALLELSEAQVSEPVRPKGPPTTLTVKFAVRVSRSGHVIEGAELAAFDGVEPAGETFIAEAPALDDIPGRRDTKLRLGYDAKSDQLSCALIMQLARPLGDDELERLRDDWLVDLADGFEAADWNMPPHATGEYSVLPRFDEVMAIEQVASSPSRDRPAPNKRTPPTKRRR